MSTATAVTVAITFVWLGMVLAISFLEAPLKFRAPGITIPLGLGIGRLVFRALNACEAVWAIIVVVAVVVVAHWSSATVPVATAVAVGALICQIVGVRPALTRRSDAGLAGANSEHRSHAHLVYVGFEVIKVIALLILGIAALGS